MSQLPSEFQTEKFARGLEVRREVLGAQHVNKSIQNVDPFMVPLQKLVTKYCWGDLWTRTGMDRRTRSLLNIAMLSALNRHHELRIHTTGALNNGVSKEELQEVLLQVAIYCGVPAALDSARTVKETIDQYGISTT